MSPIRKAIRFLVPYTFLLLLAAGCGGDGEEGGYEPPVTSVRVAEVEQRSFTEYFLLIGTTRAEKEATLVFEVPGVIEEILADRGSVVRRDAPIARLNDDLYRAALDEAAAARDLAVDLHERSAALEAEGGISEFDLSRLEQERAMADARYRTAKAQHDRTVLRAPFDGSLDRRFLDVGDFAGPAVPFVRLLDSDPMKVEVPVPEVYLARVAVGDGAEIHADHFPDHVFEGKVTFVSNEVDGPTRTVIAEITVPNGDGLLRPGMTVRAKLAKAEARAVAAHAAAAKKKTKQGTAARAALDRAFVLARKAGVVIAMNDDGREWAPVALSGLITTMRTDDDRAVLILSTTGEDVPLSMDDDDEKPDEDEDEPWRPDPTYEAGAAHAAGYRD